MHQFFRELNGLAGAAPVCAVVLTTRLSSARPLLSNSSGATTGSKSRGWIPHCGAVDGGARGAVAAVGVVGAEEAVEAPAFASSSSAAAAVVFGEDAIGGTIGIEKLPRTLVGGVVGVFGVGGVCGGCTTAVAAAATPLSAGVAAGTAATAAASAGAMIGKLSTPIALSPVNGGVVGVGGVAGLAEDAAASGVAGSTVVTCSAATARAVDSAAGAGVVMIGKLSIPIVLAPVKGGVVGVGGVAGRAATSGEAGAEAEAGADADA